MRALLTENQAAAYLLAAHGVRVSIPTLRSWRVMQTPDTPRYQKIGPLVRYEPAELDGFAQTSRAAKLKKSPTAV